MIGECSTGSGGLGVSLDMALVGLGAAAVRSATKLWLGDKSIAGSVATDAVDLLAGRLTTHFEQRKLRRMVESFTDAVAERVTPLVEREFQGLPENERLAAVEAVRETFGQSPLDNDDLFAADLDARYLERHVRQSVGDMARDLSRDGTALYDLLLRECCGYVIEIARGLPVFGPTALTEILRRETQIIKGIQEMLARMPRRHNLRDFRHDYRQLVARTLDHVEVFGATLEEASRRYPLSVAYLSLTAVSGPAVDGSGTLAPSQRVEEVLVGSPRLLIRGEAGLGKTTLLQWIAVRCARGDLEPPLTTWNEMVPFFVRFRRYADRDLPAPERFLDEVGRHIAKEMPEDWVQQQLRSGRAVVLVDGVDELEAERRHEARSWLLQLVTTFPDARYVITSRPSATPSGWLSGEEFAVADLQPMLPNDIRTFINRWHYAIQSQTPDEGERRILGRYEKGLLRQLATRRHLRRLAGYPLLCALLCALHRDRRGDLPDNRIELYDVALQMLLERRDAERRVQSIPGLDRTRKTLLLANLAYWLIRNSRTDAPVDRVVEQLQRRLAGMREVAADAVSVYRHLLERTGLLREPVEGRVDFVHRTFQEYLAARAAVDNDDIGILVAHSELDDWHEVIVMAAGHASRGQREELLKALLERGDREKRNRYTLHLIALACLETAPELDPAQRGEIEQRAARLLPPRSLNAARAFASAGPFVLDLLAAAQPRNARETAATIRAAAAMGVDEALPLLSRFAEDTRETVQRELLAAWPQFSPETYARQILGKLPIPALDVRDPTIVPSVRHLQGVRSLSCSAPRGGNLEFVPQQVTRLWLRVNGALDLSTLNTPLLTTLRVSGARIVDVQPLTALPQLATLTVTSGQVRNLRALAEFPALRTLALLQGSRVSDFHGFSSWARLSTLRLANVGGLTDLNPLGFLKNPQEIHLEGCSDLRSLGGVGNWAHSLRKLTLRDCTGLDLGPLTVLSELTELDLYRTHVSDLRPLPKIPRLRQLTIHSARTTRDLAPLADMPYLRELRISQGAPVNLAALANVRDLTIKVEGVTQVIGAGNLHVESWDSRSRLPPAGPVHTSASSEDPSSPEDGTGLWD